MSKLTSSTASVEAAFDADPSDIKINISLPGFREDSGKIFIPPTVRHVEKGLNKETILTRDPLPIEGYHPFLDLGTRLAYGANTPAYKSERVRIATLIELTDRSAPFRLSHYLAPYASQAPFCLARRMLAPYMHRIRRLQKISLLSRSQDWRSGCSGSGIIVPAG